MNCFDKIFDNLTVNFIDCKHIQLVKPLQIGNHYQIFDRFVLINSGDFLIQGNYMTSGDFFLMKSGLNPKIQLGLKSPSFVSLEDYISLNQAYFNLDKNEKENNICDFTCVSFESTLFDLFNFFPTINIPVLNIKKDLSIIKIFKKIIQECQEKKIGKNQIIQALIHQLVFIFVRKLLIDKTLSKQIMDNTKFIRDSRILNIVDHVKHNLNKDLSNKKLASIANVSNDYFSQYFKTSTQISPQDFIENQRMYKAIKLLCLDNENIQSIGKKVGYKDTAYFCRRFKNIFGIPAGKIKILRHSAF